MRHRLVRNKITLGKEPRKMSKSYIEILVSNATAPEIEVLVQPTVNINEVGTGDIFENADTANIVSPNCVVKYVNIRWQAGLNKSTDNQGWIEYAIVLYTEQTGTPVSTADFININTQTLGDIANNRFRGKCLWNGAIPMNVNQTKVLDLAIKIPDKWCKWKRGQYLMLVQYYRGTDTADTTSACDTDLTVQYKCYI